MQGVEDHMGVVGECGMGRGDSGIGDGGRLDLSSCHWQHLCVVGHTQKGARLQPLETLCAVVVAGSGYSRGIRLVDSPSGAVRQSAGPVYRLCMGRTALGLCIACVLAGQGWA